jgi:Immunity protein 7
MFEFHGWITVQVADPEEITEEQEEVALQRIQKKVAETQQETYGWFEVKTSMNNLTVIVAHGLRNHTQPMPLELFVWVGENYPLSYGLLYIHDNEWDLKRDNEFVVYRLAQGKITEFQDQFLSPVIPTIESER